MTTNADKRLAQLEQFLAVNSAIIKTALRAHAERQEEVSKELLAAYTAVKDVPEARAKQDETLISTDGLLTMSTGLQDSANTAREALDDLDELEEGTPYGWA